MLTLAYLAFTVLGCGYAVFATAIGHLGDFFGADGHDGGHDGHGADGFHFTFYSPLAVAATIGGTGAWGLILGQAFGLRGGMSVAIAFPLGFATSYASLRAAWSVLSSSTASTFVRMSDLPGKSGAVTAAIPAGGTGEVEVMVGSQRHIGAARAHGGGQEIPRGAAIRVVEVSGSTLIVERRE